MKNRITNRPSSKFSKSEKTSKILKGNKIIKKITKKGKISSSSLNSNKLDLRSKKKLFTVGIGASAGGLEAFKDLLKALPINTGMVFIFVQHLDPTHESLAPEIFSRSTKMPVHEVEDGMSVLPNHVYLNPPNFSMELSKGLLRLHSREQTSQHMTIDFFFQSLAKDQKDKSIGVILSGTADDGTKGIKAIKDEGGLVMVQDPKSAKYDGMPKSAIAAGRVDYILPPESLAKALTKKAKYPHLTFSTKTSHEVLASHEVLPEDSMSLTDKTVASLQSAANPIEEILRSIFDLLRAQTHVDFSNYKLTTLKRRIQRRMMVRKVESLAAYAKDLQEHPEEVKALYDDMLINVTEFFRDPDSFKVLTTQVFPKLLKNRPAHSPIRAWTPGCASGEEVYSLAILLTEFLIKTKNKFPVQIFGTDISESAIQKARAGFYSEAIENSVNKERLQVFFDKVKGGYKIKKEIRDMCMFSKHDVTNDPPFSKLDFLSCRNVFIYFTHHLQKRIIPVFHYAIKPGGFLFLGKSDSLGGGTKLFKLVNKSHKIYVNTFARAPMVIDFPLSSYRSKALEQFPKSIVTHMSTAPMASADRNKGAVDFEKNIDRIVLAKYAPPAVVINSDFEIVQFRGRTSPYLEPASGVPSTNLLKMAKQELRHPLRATILAAQKQNKSVRQEALTFEVDDKLLTVNIEALPANPLASPKMRHYVIFFETMTTSKSLEKSLKGIPFNKRNIHRQPTKNLENKLRNRIERLEQEVTTDKLYHESMIEEFEGAQEELVSTNEELQSTNEELQSANEEMETAKEEIQSSNEELTSVNEELQSRNKDLFNLSSDLNNILGCVEIPILIVGNDHRLRKFTPMAEKYFKLISSDVGRPLRDIKTEFDLNLETLINKVIQSLIPLEKEIQDHHGRWVRLQIRPYKTIDNRIDGAVITLIDIESLKQQIIISEKARNYLSSISETVPLPLVILDDHLLIRSANRAFWEHFKPSQKATGKDFFATLEVQGVSLLNLRKLLTETLTLNKKIVNLEMSCDFPKIGTRIILISANLIQWIGELFQDTKESQAILLSFEDITERRLIEITLKESEEKFRSFLTSFPEAIVITNNKRVITFVNTKAESIFEYEPQELVGLNHEILVPQNAQKFHPSQVNHYLENPTARSMSERKSINGVTKKGREFPIQVGLNPLQTKDGLLVTCVVQDMTKTKAAEEERERLRLLEKKAREEAEKANRIKNEFLATLSHELRTPLTSILSWAQLIQRRQFDSEKLKHGIEMIEKSAKIQGQLIDDMLDVVRIQSGKLSINFSDINPIEPVKLAIESLHLLADHKQITIDLEANLKDEKVWGDRERIQQIMWNLLTNAIKFSEKGGLIRIEIKAFEDNGEKFVSIKVIDQGKGISPDFLPSIFERFSQADSSSVRVHGGLGLGLSIVRDLVQLQGGSVRAGSEGINKGATFTILFPAKVISLKADNIATTSPPGLAANNSGNTGPANSVENFSTEKILKGNIVKNETSPEEIIRAKLTDLNVMLVDDDSSTLEVLIEDLKFFGAIPHPYSTAAQAFAAFEKLKPDVLVSDIAMPEEDGYSLIGKIRKLSSEQGGKTPALALTAFASERDVQRALSAGFDVHMAKPFDALALAQAIAALVKKG